MYTRAHTIKITRVHARGRGRAKETEDGRRPCVREGRQWRRVSRVWRRAPLVIRVAIRARANASRGTVCSEFMVDFDAV